MINFGFWLRTNRAQTAGTGKELRDTILLVDSDLGFVFWLGQALDAAGYNAIPALNVPSAEELIHNHKLSLDTLVIDPFLPDAFPFISRHRQSVPKLNVVAAIPEDWGTFPHLPDVDAILRKPQRLNGIALFQWLNLIQSFFSPSGVDLAQRENFSLKKAGSDWD